MDEDEEEENVKHECEMKGQYITVRTAIISVFAIMTPITTALSYYVSNNFASLNSQIQLQLLPMIEKDKACLARIIRLENDQLKANSQREESLSLLREIKTDLKYNYPTRIYVDAELKKKVDLERIDKRNLKN